MSLASARKHAGEGRPPLRPVRLGPASVTVERRGDGAILMRSPEPLPPYPDTLTERLAYWAKTAPDRIFLAQRDPAGGWRTLSYAATLLAVRAIAAALLERDSSPDRPVAILSGNDIDHAMLGLAAMHVGIPYAPISVPYSLMSQDFKKLTAIIDILTPGLVFAANGAAFARAISARCRPPWKSRSRQARRPDGGRRILPNYWRQGRPPPLMRRTPPSAPIRSQKSCSPPARPGSRKA